MKSFEELLKFKDEVKKNIVLRNLDKPYKVVVEVGSNGVENGAKKVLNCLVQLMVENDYPCIVTQSDNVQFFEYVPVVNVYDQEGNQFVYVNVNEQKATEIFNSHIMNNSVVSEYLAKGGK